MIYWQIFIAFFKAGLLGFGGGMAVISLIQEEVLRYGWLTETEFVDIVAVSQVTPGPIGMNCATYVGYTATGTLAGSLLASFAIILPSLIIMLVICKIYDYIQHRWKENRVFQGVMRAIRFIVVLIVAHAAYTLMTPAAFPDYRSYIIFGIVLVFMLLPKKHLITRTAGNPILLMLLAGIAGWCIYG